MSLSTKQMNSRWQTKKLGEICELINRGISPKYTDSQGLRVLNQKCVRDHEINFDLSRFHDFNSKKVSSDKIIQIGDVLVNSTGTGTLGRVAQVKELPFEATVDSHITIIRPIKNMFYDAFFGYALIFIEEEISKKGEGCGGQTELARNTLKNDFEITYPKSLAEQQRIVAILAKAFSAITKAKSNAKQNYKNAKEIFDNYLQNVFLNENTVWEIKKLGETCEIIMGQSPDGKTYNTDGIGVPLINGPVEFGPDSFSETEKSKFTTKPTKYCRQGDLILCVRGSTTGRINIAGFDACIGRGVAAIRHEKNQAWINYYMLCARKIIFSLGTGSTFPNVSSELLFNLTLPFPSYLEQQKIIAKLETLSINTKKLEIIYKQKINNLNILKKTILQKAFSGQLTTENIDIDTQVQA